MDNDPKAKSKSVSLHPDLWEQVEAKALREYGGNRSAYLRVLIEQDLEGTMTAKGGDLLFRLCEEVQPTLVDDLREHLLRRLPLGKEGPAQAKIIARLMEALVTALRRQDFAPAEPFQIYNSVDQLRATLSGSLEARLATLASALEDPAFRKALFYDLPDDEELPHAAEDKGLYDSSAEAAQALLGAIRKRKHSRDKRASQAS